jgi:hypothetical protein
MSCSPGTPPSWTGSAVGCGPRTEADAQALVATVLATEWPEVVFVREE